MALILDLPTETLQEIVEYVIAHDWRPTDDLKALCLACKTLCGVAQGFLYREFFTDFARSYHRPPIGPRYLNFASTLAQRPSLRTSVRTLELHLRDYDSQTQLSWIPAGYDLGALRAAAPQYFSSAKKRDMWAKHRPLQVFPHVETLLSILPRLEVLRLHSPHLGLGIESVPYLTNLRELELTSPKGPKIMSLLVFLPQLRKLKLEALDIAGLFLKREDREREYWRIAEGTLSVEDLCIRECTMRNDILQCLVRSCRRLTHFDYLADDDMEWEKRRHFRRQGFDTEGLHAALSLHEVSLQSLSLMTMNDFEREHNLWSPSPPPPYPPFTSFPHLTSLKIEYFRMRYENLPPALTYLYLSDCEGVWGAGEVEKWKAIKRDFCPDMEKFEIMCTDECRATQRKLKYMNFHWGCWSEQTREWTKDGFLLKVWFQDFVDGTYHFSQGTDDTGDIDSNGDKIRYEGDPYSDVDENFDGDEPDDTKESEVKDKTNIEDGDKICKAVGDEDEDEDEDMRDVNGEVDKHNEDVDARMKDVENGKIDTVDQNTTDTTQDHVAQPPIPSEQHHSSPIPSWLNTLDLNNPSDDTHSTHTSSQIAQDVPNAIADETAMSIDPYSPFSNGTFEWVQDMISDAEHEEDDMRVTKMEDLRAVFFADEEGDMDWDDGWKGGVWRAPKGMSKAEKDSET